jgi:PII-like signaling protein
MQMTEAVLLRIFVGEDDHANGHPLHRLIVERARSARLAGATVLPGPVGFGPSGRVRSDMNVDAGARSPIVVEIIDEEDRIMAFLHELDGLIDTGLVTIEKVRAWRPA